MPATIGRFDQRVVDLLGLSVAPGTPILIGESNIAHMRREHLLDHHRYGARIGAILIAPDFVAMHPRGSAVEYIRVFEDDWVLVAVRPSVNGLWFARTLFVMAQQKIARYNADPNILKRYR